MRPALARLASAGLVEEALALVRRLGDIASEERALQCELEALSGNRESAYALAGAIIAKNYSPAVTARALLVAARIDCAHGRSADGQANFSVPTRRRSKMATAA